MKKPFGLHPSAFAAWISACAVAEVDPARVVLTIGQGRAGSCTHLADGVFLATSGGTEPYCAAMDVKVYDLAPAQIERLLDAAYSHCFFGGRRRPTQPEGQEFLHLVYAGVSMIHSRRLEFHKFCGDDEIDSSLRVVDFPVPTESQIHLLHMAFYANNQVNG